MPVDHFVPDTGLKRGDARSRPAPRCYSRPAVSRVVRQSPMQADGNAVLITLGIISCAVAFLLASAGWSF